MDNIFDIIIKMKKAQWKDTDSCKYIKGNRCNCPIKGCPYTGSDCLFELKEQYQCNWSVK